MTLSCPSARDIAGIGGGRRDQRDPAAAVMDPAGAERRLADLAAAGRSRLWQDPQRCGVYSRPGQSARYAPTEWARTAFALYRRHKADRIVAEVNNGGDMVESTIRMIDPIGAEPPITPRAIFVAVRPR
jgi:phage terminase large subunit-like protein